MKILCVVPSYWPAIQFGGPIFSVHGLNKALVKKGASVTVYTTNTGLDDNTPVNVEVDVDGVKITYFSISKFFDFLGATGWQFSLPLTQALKRDLQSFDIVYIVALWNYPVAAGAYYCRKYGKPYVISPRGALYPETKGEKSWKKWPYYNLITKRDLRNASAVHYTTTDEVEKCHELLGFKNRAILIPNGLDLSEFKYLPEKSELKASYPYLKDKKVLLFLSRINWKKGLDILIKAYSQLLKERNDVHLLIVGNDESGYAEKVKGWISEFGMKYVDLEAGDYSSVSDAHVTFTGMLKGVEKLEALAGSDIFVLPSYSENFGMAVVEAMACGTPVLISNKVGIYREVEQNRAGMIVEADSESLYRGLMKLL